MVGITPSLPLRGEALSHKEEEMKATISVVREAEASWIVTLQFRHTSRVYRLEGPETVQELQEEIQRRWKRPAYVCPH